MSHLLSSKSSSQWKKMITIVFIFVLAESIDIHWLEISAKIITGSSFTKANKARNHSSISGKYFDSTWGKLEAFSCTAEGQMLCLLSVGNTQQSSSHCRFFSKERHCRLCRHTVITTPVNAEIGLSLLCLLAFQEIPPLLT